MKEIKTTDAVGHILCHDITQIIPGVSKAPAFRKGHVVRDEDIPVLLSMGKDHLFVWEQLPGMVHENDAALRLFALCADEHMTPSEVKEGKIDVIAARGGLLTVDVARLRQINALGELMIATRHGNTAVAAGDKLAGTRVIPLVIADEKLRRAEEIGGGTPLLALRPFQPKRTAILTTGNEVFYGRIADKFTPVVERKLAEYGTVTADCYEMEPRSAPDGGIVRKGGGEPPPSRSINRNCDEITISADCYGTPKEFRNSLTVQRVLLPDDPARITAAILTAIDTGAEFVLCTGGMSVDPDDRTPLAIKNTGARMVSYGAPVLPGAMFLLAYLDGIPIVGLPGCVMYAKRTIFDLILPRLLAEVPVTPDDLAALGHGGLCLDCAVCTYPNCGFGKGV